MNNPGEHVPPEFMGHPDLEGMSDDTTRAEVDMYEAVEVLKHAALVGDFELALQAHRQYTGDPSAELPGYWDSLKDRKPPEPRTPAQEAKYLQMVAEMRQRAIDSLNRDKAADN